MEDAIVVDGLSKRYLLGTRNPANRLTEAIAGVVMRRRSRPPAETLRALDDVSFAIPKGAVVGIIGRNGAGKSTLLKILARVTRPDEGTAELHGRVGSLLEVGTGFHPELTGRENIHLSGAILGMRGPEIRARLDEILAFAELERFADTPVKRYSSGMYTRLAFSVAAHLDAEILLVDEALAVGDAAFQAKCLGKMGDLATTGRTILYVSHNMGSIVRLCDTCLWLEEGTLRGVMPPSEAVDHYLAAGSVSTPLRAFDRDPERPAQFTAVEVHDGHGRVVEHIETDDQIAVKIDLAVREPIPTLHASLSVVASDGTVVLFSDSRDADESAMDLLRGDSRIAITLPPRLLAPGSYSLNLGLAGDYSGMLDRQPNAVSFTVVDHTSTRGDSRQGYLALRLPWSIEPADRDGERR